MPDLEVSGRCPLPWHPAPAATVAPLGSAYPGAGPAQQSEGTALIGAHDQVHADGLPGLSFLLAGRVTFYPLMVQF